MIKEYSVSDLSRLIKGAIERDYSNISIIAEVGGASVSSGGHVYFKLKDASSDALIEAVCWKGNAKKQNFQLENGLKIKCFGSVSTYAQKSQYQFIAERFEIFGIGELLKILEDRKLKLAQEGLFDPSRKKNIPFIPKVIGVITSPTGAVIRDILHRIGERFPTKILLWPVAVQGADAAMQIVEAIDGMNAIDSTTPIYGDFQKPDVIIVARGGGSLEDLMPFNEESVVRAVARSIIPVISAVGHETDTTLIDFASDKRAPTPTAAAEFVVPEKEKLRTYLMQVFERLNLVFRNQIEERRTILNSYHILNVNNLFNEKTQKIEYLHEKILNCLRHTISDKRITITNISIQKPIVDFNIAEIFQKLRFLFDRHINTYYVRYNMAALALDANSHVSILKKGFAFIESDKDKAVTCVKDAEKLQKIKITFHDGMVRAKIEPEQKELLF